MVKIIIVYLALILMFSSCYGWMAGKDDVFINNRNDNFLNQIKLNGYYYSRYNQNYFKLYFFYQNGVVFTPSVVEGTLKDAEKYIKDTTLRKVVDLKHPIRHIDLTNIDDSKQYKDNWGIYKITNDKLAYYEIAY